MPSLPGFGPPPVTAAMEPVPLGPGSASAVAVQPVSAPAAQGGAINARPAFFVQWKPNMTGMTRRPRVDSSTPLPRYPDSAMRSGEGGTTTLESCVTVDGHLTDVKLSQSSGSAALDSATLAWAQTAKFVPAEFDGQPMAVCGWRLDYLWKMDKTR